MANKKIALLKTLSIYRLWNFFLLKLSYQISILFKKPIHWGYPIAISIEPTTACNLKCPECPSGLRQFTRPTGNLKTDVNDTILKSLGRHLQYINYYFQGEPFINPQFLDFVKAARKENIYVLTSTNAHFMSKKTAEKVVASGLSELIISVDGTTQETYENYRVEGKLDTVLSGLTAIKEAKEKAKSQFPIVTIQFLVTAQNEHQIPEVQSWVKKYGADNLNLKTIQVYNYENGNKLLPKNEDYSRYKKGTDGKYVLKNKMSNYCWRMWTTCVFTWDGSIVPCCFDKDAKYKMGNISKAEFKHIWKDGLYTDFRQKILKQRADIDICKNCSEGSKIWV